MEPSTQGHKHLPHRPGVYLMRDASGQIVYVGKARDLAKRVSQYFNPEKADHKVRNLMPLVRGIDYIVASSEREALLVERRLILRHKPFFNYMWRDDKSYPYVKLTDEDYPRLFLTRQTKDKDAKYFGPYPKTGAIRGLLRYLWRSQMLPLRPCRWDFSEAKPLDPRKIQSCLYYHTRQCPAPCAGRISPPAYRRIARRAALFFKGRFDTLRLELEKEMRSASNDLDYERAAKLRDNVSALEHMGERITLLEVKEADLSERMEASRGVSELQAALALPRPPVHIEGFDISHLFGRQTVGSMVCFEAGRPHKSHYRKFKIRGVPGIDDFASMRETVFRRYRGLIEEGKPLPDLLLIDGGKGQLASAQDALKELGVKIPLAALAKREEEIFTPGREDSIKLGADSPALQLLQRIRDEAHRFGVTFHRSLRDKAMFGEEKK